jgi:homopolymeric O-antigen transport system ATP-binding protein
VAFAEVEKFIDTPVKRYSSGMHVRLAFAVAAHLEPEILIIDEVLAVGDLNFQNKCLGKMGEIRSGGRTVFFVSHNMAAIENLCPSTIVLDAGRIVFEDESKQAINYYLKSVLSPATAEASLADRKDRSGSGKVRLTSFHVEDLQGNKLTAVRSGMDVVFVFGFRCRGGEKLTDVDVGFSIHSNFDQVLFVLYSSYVGQTFQKLPSAGEFRCHVERLPLSAGSYTVGARVTVAGEEADWLRNAVGRLDVTLGDFYGTGREGFGGSTRFLVRGEWGIQELCSIY